MSVKNKIEERVKLATTRSYFKVWYKRRWGRWTLLGLGLIAIFVLWLAILIVNNVLHIYRGDVFDQSALTWVTASDYEQNQKAASQVLTEDDPALGTDEPLVYIVAYQSFACPYSQENQADLKKMLDKFGPLVRFVFKDFPTEGLHENVFNAHLAANCANDQKKFWEYHDMLFANQGKFSKPELKAYAEQLGLDRVSFDACLDSEKFSQEIRQDYAQGVNLGVSGTPSYVVNGQLVKGTVPMDLWEQVIGFILKQEI